MKRKTLTLTLSLLACFALIGVGFAAWVITTTTTDDASGNIKVDTVTDNRLNVVAEWCDENGTKLADQNPSVVYGYNDTTVDWLNNTNRSDATKKQSLTVYLKVTVSRKNGSEAIDWDKLDLTSTVSANETYTKNMDVDASDGTEEVKGYFGKLPAAVKTQSLGTSTTQEGVYYLTFTFNWGQLFGGNNPLDYYKNIQNPTEQQMTDAYNALNKLEATTSLDFTITVSAKLNA